MPFPLFLYLSVELMAVSWVDFKTKIISNYWVLLHVGIFVLVSFFYPTKYPIEFNSFLYPVLFVGVGFLLFVLKIMGGGDSKFLATFYLLIPPMFHDDFTEVLLITTILVGSVLLIMNLSRNLGHILYEFSNGRRLVLKKYIGTKFTFAPVILLAFFFWGAKEWSKIQ